jgi:hypothetical protein
VKAWKPTKIKSSNVRSVSNYLNGVGSYTFTSYIRLVVGVVDQARQVLGLNEDSVKVGVGEPYTKLNFFGIRKSLVGLVLGAWEIHMGVKRRRVGMARRDR